MKTQTNKKKIFDIVITVIEILIVIFAITLSAIVIANPITSSAEVAKGNTKLLPVLTESMNGTYEFYKEHPEFVRKGKFEKGDLVIAKNPDGDLEVGDIVTYVGNVEGTKQLITHRIVEINKTEDGEILEYIVQGDNRQTNPRTEQVAKGDVLAVYKSSIGGLGTAINWLQESSHFLLVVVLPLIALFIYNIVAFVLMITKAKAAKQLEENGSVLNEEELKQKAIEEYLASQNAKKEEPVKEEKPEPVAEPIKEEKVEPVKEEKAKPIKEEKVEPVKEEKAKTTAAKPKTATTKAKTTTAKPKAKVEPKTTEKKD